MKKFFVFLFPFFLFFFAFQKVDADYATDYQAYINASGSYQTAYNDYQTARANYLASGSLDSEYTAKQATLKLLQLRDSLVVNYLQAVSSKIEISQGFLDTDRASLQSQLAAEIAWHQAHSTKLASAGNLTDLVTDSNEAKTRWTSTRLIIYQSLISLGSAQNSYIRGKLTGEITALESKIAQIRTNQDKDVTLIERSLFDVKNKIIRSQDKDNLAKSLIFATKPEAGSATFLTAQTYLVDSSLYLKDANQGLLQIITQIKTN